MRALIAVLHYLPAVKRKPAAGRYVNLGPNFLEGTLAKHSKSFKSVQFFEPGIPLLGVYQEQNKT